MTSEYLKEIFEYRTEGYLVWKKPRKKVVVGTRFGTIETTPSGYKRRIGTVDQKNWREHRLIFLMFHGHLPRCVDHINGDALDNRIENLREATPSENGMNARPKRRRLKTTHFKGVNKTPTGWVSRICLDRKTRHLGIFETAEDAARAYDRAAKDLFGDRAKLNFEENR